MSEVRLAPTQASTQGPNDSANPLIVHSGIVTRLAYLPVITDSMVIASPIRMAPVTCQLRLRWTAILRIGDTMSDDIVGELEETPLDAQGPDAATRRERC